MGRITSEPLCTSSAESIYRYCYFLISLAELTALIKGKYKSVTMNNNLTFSRKGSLRWRLEITFLLFWPKYFDVVLYIFLRTRLIYFCVFFVSWKKYWNTVVDKSENVAPKGQIVVSCKLHKSSSKSNSICNKMSSWRQMQFWFM